MLPATRRFFSSTGPNLISDLPKAAAVARYDAIVIGGGHNGLTAAAYLAKAGKKVCVLERRHVLGGAAVTEEIVPGFRFSRASYLLSLFRPTIIDELQLKKHGLRWHIRDPSSFTPVRDSTKSLLLGLDEQKNHASIAAFSARDAQNYPKYEAWIAHVVKALEPLWDQVPVSPHDAKLAELWRLWQTVRPLGVKNVADLYELLTAPISKVLDRWFESDVLKASLATDGVIGLSASPRHVGTGYVLLHHVMGGLDGRSGVWGYVYGGMGAVSNALGKAAAEYGAELRVNHSVQSVLLDSGRAVGVKLENGAELHAPLVLSSATPHVTFRNLVPDFSTLPVDFQRRISAVDYESPVTKINVAVKELPNFSALPTVGSGPMPHHQTTIHMNCESVQIVHDAYQDYTRGEWSRRPAIEMTIPSSVDRTIVDGAGHVVLLFTQYTPYRLASGEWSEQTKEQYAKHVFAEIDAYAPNFSKSIVGYEVLPPPDLERIFGLTGGNIFHGAVGLDQLYFARPIPGWARYRTPIEGLLLCGSGAHPGGGVTGAPGRLAALTALGKV